MNNGDLHVIGDLVHNSWPSLLWLNWVKTNQSILNLKILPTPTTRKIENRMLMVFFHDCSCFLSHSFVYFMADLDKRDIFQNFVVTFQSFSSIFSRTEKRQLTLSINEKKIVRQILLL